MLPNNKKKEKIRIKDIAESAGVSIGTVDRVLHNRGEVKEETRQKIMSIINEMGYTPNLLAKSLASKKTFRIAAIIPDSKNNNPYWEKPLLGIQKGADEIRDFNTLVEVFTFNPNDELSFKHETEKVLKTKPDGIIFNPVFKKVSIDFTKSLDSINIPYVYIDIDLEAGNNLAYFGQNAKQGGIVAAKLMSTMFCRDFNKILVVKLADKKVISTHLKGREEGFIEFFSKPDITNFEIVSINVNLNEANEPAKSLKKILFANPDVNGVFVPSSKVFTVAEFLYNMEVKNVVLSGFDVVQKNVEYLQNNTIDFLIGQKPEEQGYNSVLALFNYIVLKKAINKTNYSPLDIIIKENIEYYNK